MACTRPRALALYRSLFRCAREMPTDERKQYVQQKTRMEFELNRTLDGDDLDEALKLGEVTKICGRN